MKFYKIPNTDRACAVTIESGDDVILCVNLYLPVDNQSKTRIENSFLSTFDATDIFIEQCRQLLSQPTYRQGNQSIW